MSRKSYPAKVILFGEYGVIHQGEILATTIPALYGQWVLDADAPAKTWKGIIAHIKANKLDFINVSALEHDAEKGLAFDSNIKSGYGMGSSGAVSAGLYDRYAKDEVTDLNLLQKRMADIESCYHGTSSGIDPLVIYLNSPVWVQENRTQALEKAISTDGFFLIDTGKKRKTGPLVDSYLAKYADDSTFPQAVRNYNILVSQAIQSCLQNDIASMHSAIHHISEWQYEHLSFAIPEAYKSLWQKSLNDPSWSMKLCGAGGGGYLMGWSSNENQPELDTQQIIRL